MATSAPSLICPQGHGPGIPGTSFCNMCGAQLVAPLPPVQPVAAIPMPQPPAMAQRSSCNLCGGDGARLASIEDVCVQCGWLRPLLPGYNLERSVFLWAQDGQAMTHLQKIPALHSLVSSISDKIGRPWIESTFNGIRLGPRQLPDVWKQAILAARILGLPKMPDVYIAGDRMWDTYTFGTDKSAFIVLGTAILNNFQKDEVLFIIAREMGHCRAGHALWKTVTRFITGDLGMHSGIMSNGLLHALNPSKLLEGAIEIPLMAWSRQSEVTADRAGLLAVGDEVLARRVLLAWSIRSARLLKQINIDEWIKQEDASDDQLTRISEMTTSSSMYTTRRLRLLGQAAREPELLRWMQSILPIRKRLAPTTEPASGQAAAPAPPQPADSVRVVCTKCNAAMRVPFTVLRGKQSLNVRCPQCKNVLTLRPKTAAPSPAPAATEK